MVRDWVVGAMKYGPKPGGHPGVGLASRGSWSSSLGVQRAWHSWTPFGLQLSEGHRMSWWWWDLRLDDGDPGFP